MDVAAFLRLFREQAGFAGPVSLRFEYSVASNDAMIADIGKAVEYMRRKVYPSI